jgi:hypothetical protein
MQQARRGLVQACQARNDVFDPRQSLLNVCRIGGTVWAASAAAGIRAIWRLGHEECHDLITPREDGTVGSMTSGDILMSRCI